MSEPKTPYTTELSYEVVSKSGPTSPGVGMYTFELRNRDGHDVVLTLPDYQAQKVSVGDFLTFKPWQGAEP